MTQTELLDAPTADLPAVIDAPPRSLAQRQPTGLATAPTVEHMLMAAIDRGIDPAGMEKLAAIYEREVARRAEAAFNAAMMAFQSEVGPILKNREATKDNKAEKNGPPIHMYYYADLEHITKVIDPLVFKHGFAYTFDSSILNGLTVVTCKVKHIEGHKESSNFTCKGSGTAMMNEAQVSASAVTFGRRYSLVLAFGLKIDNDDDGRRAAPPNPAPDADPTAPRVGTRTERQQQPAADAGPPRVRAADLAALKQQWQQHAGKPEGTVDEFVAWAGGVLGIEFVPGLKAAGNWTMADLKRCQEAMS